LCCFDVVGKACDHLVGLRFGLLAEAGEGDLVEVDVVDELLALAAGGFDLVAQFGLVEGRAGGGHAQARAAAISSAAACLRRVMPWPGGGQRGFDDGVRVERGIRPLPSSPTGMPPLRLFDAGLGLVVELLGQAHQAVGQREHGVVVAVAHGHALQQVLERDTPGFFSSGRLSVLRTSPRPRRRSARSGSWRRRRCC
jgi:hypothetical protein